MAKESVVAGQTSHSVNLFIQDSSKTNGAGLTGLAYNTASLTAYYTFTGSNCGSVAISLATLAAVNSAWSSGGFKEIDSTNMPGFYRFDLPNAVLAASKGQTVSVVLQGAANMAADPLEIELTGWNNQDGVHGGLSCLPGAVPGATGGLLIAGSNAATTFATLTSTGAFSINGTSNVAQTGDSYARIGSTGSGLTSLAPASTALTTANWTNTLATNLGTLAGHDPGATLGTSTLTQSQVSGGAYALNSSSFAFNTAFDFTSTQKASIGTAVAASAVASVTAEVSANVTHINSISTSGVTTVKAVQGLTTADTIATYTGNTPQTGDVYEALPTNFSSLAITAGGIAQSDLQTIKTQTVTCGAGVTISPAVGAAYELSVDSSGNVTPADDSITDAKIAFPGESAGIPTTFLAAMRRVWEWVTNKRTRDTNTGDVLLRNAADNATLETQVQSTSGSVDTQTKGV